ncbi:MAG: branched-chain amino acid ABC transporter ATP-binding protein/permease [Thermodesulfobacteriota bacterium]
MDRHESKVGTYGSLACMAVALVLFPLLVRNPYYLNVANIIALNTIIVVGLNLLIGFAGQISLGHAAFYGLGAYISGILTVTYGLSPWLAMALAVCLTALLALIIGIPTLRLHGHYLVMATLGFNLIVYIIMIQWDEFTGGPSGLPGIPSLTIGNWAFDSDLKTYCLVGTVAFLSIVVALNLVDSRVGRGLRALHGSEVAANCMGVRIKHYKVKVFVLSAVFASLAGSLYAHYMSFVSPKTFDIFFSVELVTMVIVGGMGNIWGVLAGAALLTCLPNLLHFFDEYKDICYGLILVGILVFLPEGLVVAVKNRLSAMRTAAREQAARPPMEAVAGPPRVEKRLPGEFHGVVLSTNNVEMNFGGLLALSQVSFDVPAGSITALIGPNGAGKTTMINVISGIYRPRRGSIEFRGEQVTGRRPYQMAERGLSRTFQNIQIFEHMSVLDNVMVGMHARTQNEFLWSMFHLPGFAGEEQKIRDRAWEVLAFLGLDGKGYSPAGSLSYGLQKRVEMARALALNPSLMLLDEPVAGLNMTESQEVAGFILKIRDLGISVLLVEHDMNLVMGVSDKVVVLNYGRKIAEGTPCAIQKDEQVLTAYLGSVA